MDQLTCACCGSEDIRSEKGMLSGYPIIICNNCGAYLAEYVPYMDVSKQIVADYYGVPYGTVTENLIKYHAFYANGEMR